MSLMLKKEHENATYPSLFPQSSLQRDEAKKKRVQKG